MKRLGVLLTMCSFAIGCWAQTQQGVVKTKGRMVNGILVAGQGLVDATVTIQGGNSYRVQNKDGSFSFPVPKKTFLVQKVQKNGYQLVDPDATRKAYQYSPNTFYIVMETPDRQSEDKLAAERKIRRTLQRQLQQREEELEELKAQNKLTQEEYHKALLQLYNDQQNKEKLIADMAKEYAEMDYDQMDELNRQISDAILNGELTKADSLLRSKGDVNTRFAEVRKAQRAEAQEEAELAKRQENLAASKEGTKKRLEDLAQDCKNYFDRFKISNQYDSAAYYIELRAELDTTRAEWSFDAGMFYKNQNNFSKGEIYLKKALSVYKRLAKDEDSLTYMPKLADTYRNLSVIYEETQQFSIGEKMHTEALGICRVIALANSIYEIDLVRTLSRNSELYIRTQQFVKAEEYLSEALSICRKWTDLDEGRKDELATVLLNLSFLYVETKRYEEGEAFASEALDIYRQLTKEKPEEYESALANSLNNLAIIYTSTNRFYDGEVLYKELLDIHRHMAKENPQAYEPELARTLNNIANLYKDTQRYSESETTYLETLDIYQRLAKEIPEAYDRFVARTYYNIYYKRSLNKKLENYM